MAANYNYESKAAYFSSILKIDLANSALTYLCKLYGDIEYL
jgi:hypothetical protein